MLWRYDSTIKTSPTSQIPSDTFTAKARDGLYEPVLADSEREAVADLLQYLENVCDAAALRKSISN